MRRDSALCTGFRELVCSIRVLEKNIARYWLPGNTYTPKSCHEDYRNRLLLLFTDVVLSTADR